MKRLRAWIDAIGLGANRDRLEREMNEEMQLHLEMEAAHLESTGVPRDEARRGAVLSFGGVERFKEEAREGMALRWLGDFAADVRFAIRSLRRTPAFTAVATLALAFSIGATTTVFGLIDTAAFRKLPVTEPDRLVAVVAALGDAAPLGSTYSTFEELRRTTPAFSDAAAFTEGVVTVAEAVQPSVAWAMHTSDNYFELLGMRPEVGRFYRVGDLHKPVVVISHDFWKTTLRGDQAIVGKTIRVNGGEFTVIGVARAHFTGTRLFTFAPALWIPVGMHRTTLPGSPFLLEERGSTRFNIIARLRDDAALEQAQADADRSAQSISAAHPQLNGLRFTLLSNASPVNPWLASRERIALFGTLLLGVVGLVLLIACANVASLLLARMSARRTEISVRLTLGASPMRLLRQFLAEGVVMALIGTAAAIAIAAIAIPAAKRLAPPLDFTSSTLPIIDARVLSIALVAGLVSAVVLALPPFVHTLATQISHQPQSRNNGRLAGARLRKSLVVVQVALSVFLLATAGLFARALNAAHAIDVGFDARNGIAFTVDPSLLPDYTAQRTEAFYERLLKELRAVRGVRSVSRALFVPLDGNNIAMRVGDVAADEFIVDEHYFRTLGLPIVAGHSFSAADTSGIQSAVINEVLAQKLGGTVVGRRVRLGTANGPFVEIVGVARGSASRILADPPRPLVWLSIHRNPKPRSTIVIRTERPPSSVFADVRASVRSLDPRLPIISLRTLADQVAVAYSAVRTAAIIGGALGFLAAILAATGIFGIVLYTVSRRTREIAVRIVMGAQPRQILRLVTTSTLRLTVLGVAIGCAMTLALPASISKTLYGVSPRDPLIVVAAAVAFIGIAVAASAIAARKALHLDPVRALRVE